MTSILPDPRLEINRMIDLLKFQAVVFSGGGRLEVMVKGKTIFSGAFDCAANEMGQKIVLKQIDLMNALKRIFESGNIRQRQVSLSDTISNHSKVQFLYDLINNERDVHI